jgi:endogenous inhibitor of DNA gyrase (YacG/DUF329 family)
MPDLRCPICEKPLDAEHSESLPFCSPRCRQIDLRRWLGEQYSMPVERDEELDESERDA